MIPIALIPFHAIVTLKDSENHIDDCVQLKHKILTHAARAAGISGNAGHNSAV
jgi:hypothetical protein